LGRDGHEIRAQAFFVSDPDRFGGLSAEWFWEDKFTIPDPPVSWPIHNAATVLAKRKETGWSYPDLAKHYGVCAGTIKSAMKLARQTSADAASVPKRARRSRWEDLNWEEVILRMQNMPPEERTKVALARHFGVSPPTIDKALKLGEQVRLASLAATKVQEDESSK
jgi:hypothetical protein